MSEKVYPCNRSIRVESVREDEKYTRNLSQTGIKFYQWLPKLRRRRFHFCLELKNKDGLL